jgi:hypothetical protein
MKSNCHKTAGDVRSRGQASADVEGLLRDSLRLGEQAYSQLMAPSFEFGRALLGDYLKMWQGVARGGCQSSCTCQVPEQDCPPRCVCDLNWVTYPGARLEGTVRVTNTGKVSRLFTFQATNLVSAGHDPDITPSLQPDQATLAPGQSVVVQVSAAGTDRLQIGRQYTAEIRVAGLYEQCVRIQVDVESERRPHCEVEQGEMPTRIRAHRWSDHFQCEEPCFEPVRRASNPDDPAIRGNG